MNETKVLSRCCKEPIVFVDCYIDYHSCRVVGIYECPKCKMEIRV